MNPSPWECDKKSGPQGAGVARSLIEISGNREEALGAEEPALPDLRQPTRPQRVGHCPAPLFEGPGMVDRAIPRATPALVEAGEHGDTFEQRRVPRAVLADDDRHRPVEGEFKAGFAKQRQAERIGRSVGHLVIVEPDALQVRRWERGVLLGAGHARCISRG
jgi:hypothetical protein